MFDLADYRTYPGARVFSGRPRGEAVRRQIGLDKLDGAAEPVTINIPADTYSFNMSFFLGLFTASVRKLGPAQFSEHYRFVGPETLLSDIPEYLGQAVKESMVLHSVRAGVLRK